MSFTAVAATGPSGSSSRRVRHQQRRVLRSRSGGRAIPSPGRHRAGSRPSRCGSPSARRREPPAHRELGKADRRIEEQLDRVVAGLAMDLDQAGKIRGAAVVEPIVIGEPGVRPRDGDELARARMIQCDGSLARRDRARARRRAAPPTMRRTSSTSAASRRRCGRSDDRRPRTRPTAERSSISPPSSTRTRSSPASRSARFTWIGVDTGVMPYSDSTTTRAPSRSGIRDQTRPRPRRSPRGSVSMRGSSGPNRCRS